jgi:hypothetical protein
MNLFAYHPGKLAAYATLSLLDLGLTYQLVQKTGGTVYEGNPIANAWLAAYGWKGLVLFKLLAMILVGGTVLLIAFQRSRLAGHILTFGCMVLVGVVLYSCSLLRHSGVPPAQGVAELAQYSPRLSKRTRMYRVYCGIRDELRKEVQMNRCTLDEAVAKLAQTENVQNGRWLRILHERYPGRDDRGCLAADLMAQGFRDAPPKFAANSPQVARIMRGKGTPGLIRAD